MDPVTASIMVFLAIVYVIYAVVSYRIHSRFVGEYQRVIDDYYGTILRRHLAAHLELNREQEKPGRVVERDDGPAHR